ncbi:MAG TPA: ABC transporter ATP-binding protein [Vicinamibacterales bacterium]|jgi:iron complex transport system ATP-binding protein
MLEVKDAWFGYDRTQTVLRGITLDVPQDAIVGILGPNGSGKTTLLRLMAGTRQPQRGGVAFDGMPLATFSRAALARRMAVVPQETQLAFDYTAGDVAMMGRYAHLGAFEIEGPADMAAIDRALESTGTRRLKDRLFATLSGGEKQRVIIASALAQLEGDGVLLLDEPTASLDLRYQIEIADLLRDLHRRRGVSIVVSTHDLALAGALCDRLVLIRDGSVMASGPTDDILTTENIRAVYGVEAVIVRPDVTARVVIPIRRGQA